MLLTVIYLHFLVCTCHFDNTCATSLLIIHMCHFQTLIPHHFSRIFGWSYVLTYNEDMSHASEFIPLKRNQVTKSFQVYINCLVAEFEHT